MRIHLDTDFLIYALSVASPERQRLRSQVDLADKLGVRQPTVSRIERREDVNLSTLRRYIRALGGELHILAEFKDESVEIGVAESKDAAGR